MENNLNEMSELKKELVWFEQVLEARILQYFQQQTHPADPLSFEPPPLENKHSLYAELVNRHQLTLPERLVLMLAFAPDLKPQALDIFFTVNTSLNRPYTEFGGIVGKRHGGFLPTVETALFLLTGGDLSLRRTYYSLFDELHVFRKYRILELRHEEKKEPFTSTALRLGQDTLDLLLRGALRTPENSPEFPARYLDTPMDWDDLVLSPQTHGQLGELMAWLKHEKTLLEEWKLDKNLKAGYRCLFYGPPGTGKTLTATLLGKQTGRAVFRIDLSRLVSKYIGETEKNLEQIFSQAEQKSWILFFDEADSLFGTRTQIATSNDRYANQETAYLLQRIEDCSNVVILASNLKDNIDEAFTRRFQSIVYFPMPQKKERVQLWKKGFSPVSRLEKGVDLDQLASDYEIAGGAIVNVIRYCSLMAIRRNSKEISQSDLMTGILREYQKEGRTA